MPLLPCHTVCQAILSVARNVNISSHNSIESPQRLRLKVCLSQYFLQCQKLQDWHRSHLQLRKQCLCSLLAWQTRRLVLPNYLHRIKSFNVRIDSIVGYIEVFAEIIVHFILCQTLNGTCHNGKAFNISREN